MGWECLTQTTLPSGEIVSHYREDSRIKTARVGGYQIDTASGNDGRWSLLLKYKDGELYLVAICKPAIPFDTEENLLKRLPLLVLFS